MRRTSNKIFSTIFAWLLVSLSFNSISEIFSIICVEHTIKKNEINDLILYLFFIDSDPKVF